MVRLIKILASITLWILMTITCVYATEIKKMENKSSYEYKYTDLNGNKGTSKHCFVRDGVDVCTKEKGTIRVVKIEKYEV